VGAALDLLFLSDRGIHWLDSSPFSYRLSATNDSRANCNWGFRIVILVRLASFYVDQPKPGDQAPAASTV